MFELLPLIAVLLTPFWGYLLWRRMKSVQRLAREQAAPPKRHIITPVEDKVKTEDGFNVPARLLMTTTLRWQPTRPTLRLSRRTLRAANIKSIGTKFPNRMLS